jgi:N-acyl amino acid synthase of PEP-CTERM/exosortase system
MFDSRYEVYLADTAECRALHHQVRYQVFCVERGFEEPERFSDYQEFDRWDQHSHHFVVQDKESGAGVAAGRIVLPTAGHLPVEDLGCITALPAVLAKPQKLAEVSRICMVRDEAKSDSQLPIQAVTRSSESEVMLGLIRAVIRYSWDHDIPHIYMLVTGALARLLKRLGVACTQVGEDIEHRGLRAPYLIDIDASWRGLVARSGEVAEMFARHYLAYFSHAEMQPLRLPSKAASAQCGLQKAAA